MPALVTIERSDTFVYCSGGCANVDDGFVRKPSLSLVFKVEHKVGRERVFEWQRTRFAADRRVSDASHHVYACARFRYWSLPGHWTEQRKIVHLLEYFGDCQIGLQSCPDSDPLRKSYTAFSTWRNRWSILPLNTIRAALPVGLYSPRVPGSPSL